MKGPRSADRSSAGQLMAVSAAVLPATFWLAYCFWNTVSLTPPAWRGLTPINAVYVAMLPAALLTAIQWRQSDWAGRTQYLLFLAWVVLGLVWIGGPGGSELVKRLVVLGLLGLTAAQMFVGGRWGQIALVAALLVVSGGLSIWTIGHALTSGFAYRAGVPINPNLPAALIGPGLLAALVLYVEKRAVAGRALLLALLVTSLYACLLLGSRGVFIALLGGVAAALWQHRPSRRDAAVLAAAGALVVVVAQMPAIPYGIWRRAVTLAERSPAPPAASENAAAPAPTTTAAAPPVAEVAPVTVAPLQPTAAKATAVGRFGEQEAASFNLRATLWQACVNYLVSGVRPFLAGGGIGTSEAVAHEANPVFRNSHNAFLQVAVDFGLVGLAILGWMHWRIVQALRRSGDWLAVAALSGVVFWLIVGLTTTVTDLHVYWVSLGAAAALGGSGTLREVKRNAA